MMKLDFHNIYENACTNIGVAQKPNFMSSFLYFFKYAFSLITPRVLNLHIKSLEIFFSRYFWPKILSSSLYVMLTLSKTTSSQTFRL